MFDYSLKQPTFWSLWRPNPLLKSIQIQGPFITLYARKTVAEELNSVLGELQGRIVNADDVEHHTIHGRMDLPFRWSIDNPHVHYIMPEKSVEQGIRDLITAIYKRAVPAVREKDHNDFLAQIESDRIRVGDEELPEFVQERIAQYDTNSPFFFPQNCQEVIQDILSKYKEHCTRFSNKRCRELIQMYILAITYSYFPNKEGPNPQQQIIKELLTPLNELEKCLEKLQKDPLNTGVLGQVRQLISEVNVNELVKLEIPDSRYLIEGYTLRERLHFVSSFIQKSLEPVKNMKKVQPNSAFPSLKRASQIFYNMMKNPILKYGVLSLAIIIVFKNCMKLK